MKKLLFLILLVLSTGRVYAALIDSLHVTPSIDEQTFKNEKQIALAVMSVLQSAFLFLDIVLYRALYRL